MKKDFKILLFYPNEQMLGIVPSNLAILSACLKKAGFQVKLFDCSIYKPKGTESNDDTRVKLGHVKKTNINDYLHPIENDIYEDFIKVLSEYKPNVIGMNLIDSTIKFAFSFLDKIKDHHIVVIAGGVGTTVAYNKVLSNNRINFACVGEGEEAFVEFCNKLYNNESCENIKNIYFKDENGNIIKNPLRSLIDINKLPTPDFSIYENWRIYRPFMDNVVRMLPMDIDRGCPYSCTFCAAPVLRSLEGYKKYYRRKTFNVVFKEMKHLIKKYKLNFLYITSETFLAMPLIEFEQFAERYKREIDLPFWCQSRLDSFTDEKTKLLSEMGCQSVSVGLEHGSEIIREKLLNKHLSNKKLIEAVKTLHKYKIHPTINSMIGLPDETRENAFETIKVNKEISKILEGNHNLNIFTLVPFSGTKLRDVCIEKGYIKDEDEIPFSLITESMLTMPSMSKAEIKGLEKTMSLYILLPESYWPDIKIAEKDDEEGNKMFEKFRQLIKVN